MKIIIQRVKKAQVSIEAQVYGQIQQGLLLLVGVGPEDQKEDLDYAVRKLVNMRIFSDTEGKMNLSVKDIQGEILSISQFTLFADTKKGNRPAFTGAAKPDMAEAFYQDFNRDLAKEVPVETGIFGADMQVGLVNDGPVTIILDTKKGNRPAFTGAAKPDVAEAFYQDFNRELAKEVPVKTGIFGADMQVELVNDGPVTIILDTKNR